jgi:hypothetical protein
MMDNDDTIILTPEERNKILEELPEVPKENESENENENES